MRTFFFDVKSVTIGWKKITCNRKYSVFLKEQLEVILVLFWACVLKNRTSFTCFAYFTTPISKHVSVYGLNVEKFSFFILDMYLSIEIEYCFTNTSEPSSATVSFWNSSFLFSACCFVKECWVVFQKDRSVTTNECISFS